MKVILSKNIKKKILMTDRSGRPNKQAGFFFKTLFEIIILLDLYIFNSYQLKYSDGVISLFVQLRSI